MKTRGLFLRTLSVVAKRKNKKRIKQEEVPVMQRKYFICIELSCSLAQRRSHNVMKRM